MPLGEAKRTYMHKTVCCLLCLLKGLPNPDPNPNPNPKLTRIKTEYWDQAGGEVGHAWSLELDCGEVERHTEYYGY